MPTASRSCRSRNHSIPAPAWGGFTLNVLLSFAQFERELIGERVRDKIAASKRKGLWVGGPVPLGYAAVDKKIVVVAAEAEAIRTIFARYLELGSVRALAEDLDRRGIRSKPRRLSDGRTIGGVHFCVGALAHPRWAISALFSASAAFCTSRKIFSGSFS